MRTVLIASLRHHRRRYVAACVAVVIGVAFVVVTGMLTGATRDGLTADVGAPVAGVDHVIRIDDARHVSRLMEGAAARDVPALTLGYAMEPVSRNGVQLSPSADVGEASLDPLLQWQQLEDGRFPTTPGEAVADVNAAKRTGVEVGDVVRIGTGAAAVDVEVVGTVDSPPTLGASLYVPWATLQRFEETLWVDSVAWGGAEELASRLAPGSTVEPTATWVAERHAEISRGVDVLAVMALLFVVIALTVGALVIANTFAILFAQRTRDFALLRCVGVTRRQLRRAVRLEALVLGLVASSAGVVVGAVTGAGLVVLVRHWFADMGSPRLDPVWAGAALGLGVLVTLVAAWLPTRSATQVAPLAALRPAGGIDVRTVAGRWRITFAVLTLATGAGLLVLALLAPGLAGVAAMLAGGVLSFVGVLLLGPLLVPALIRLVGGLAGVGPVRRLATGNAVRNPRRTATTAASLLVGVTLTVAVLTGLASSRTAIDRDMDASHPLDATVTAVDRPLTADVVRRAEAVEDVRDLAVLDGTFATLGEERLAVVGTGGRASAVRGPQDLAPPDGVALLPYDVAEDLPRALAHQVERDGQVTLTVAGRAHTLDVRLDTGWGRAAIVSAATLASMDADPDPVALWVRAADGADAEDLSGDLAALAGAAGAELGGGYTNRSWVYLQVDILTGAVVGLLGIAVVIALIGIANTLGLSVLERSRENALLRAMGLTRTQLRRSMALEGLLLSVVAALMGTVIGLVFAWVGVRVMVEAVVDSAVMTVPVGQVAAVAVVAGLAGLAACVLPARRAARVAPAAGLTLD